jgi:multicomponent Na+:H+ antiporter subunit E
VLRLLPVVAWIVAVWTALWGDVSVANLVGGALVAAFLLAAVRPPARRVHRRVHAGAAARYGARFVRDLVVATLEVAGQVFWPVERLRPSVVAVPMASRDPGLLALVANTVTLTPGTLTLDVDADAGVLWVHVLHLREGGESDLVAQAQALELLGARALGVDVAPPARVAPPEGSRP